MVRGLAVVSRFKHGHTETNHGWDDDCGTGEFVTTRIMRRARKTHRCGECRHPIVPGEVYEYYKGIWDGQASDMKTCICCAKARCALTAELGRDACIMFGSLHEALCEYDPNGDMQIASTTKVRPPR